MPYLQRERRDDKLRAIKTQGRGVESPLVGEVGQCGARVVARVEL